MKVCVIQPAYSTDYSLSDKYFEDELKLLNQCDDSMDIIVMPEACDVPCLAGSKEQGDASSEKYREKFLEEAKKTAIRCNAIVFVNARYETETGFRNTTYAIGRDGEVKGHYFKQHLVASEVDKSKLDAGYSFEFEEPTVIEIEGIRFGFLICYDTYFYEAYANMARYNLDAIIGCSHQRSDSHNAIEIMSRFLAYNTNAYVFRSSVSMDENSDIGGGSMIVSPEGKVLANLESRIGMATAEIDINKKYYKPAGFGNPPASHYEYIEIGRRPWKYRPGGSAIVMPDNRMNYPRVCAHRGFNSIAPENSMAAFGAAIAMGAEEIEFDLWFTRDGEVVSCHDSTLDRVSDGTGNVCDYTYEELLKFDFGAKFGEKFKGLKILKFEEILKKFSCHAIMNIHVKSIKNALLSEKECIEKLARLIKKYDCEKYVYFMSADDGFHALAREVCPHITRCMGGGNAPWEIVERAIKYDCKKVQLFKPYFNQQMIDKAHENGIICNVFWSDDAEEAKKFIEMGIDTILTNDYNLISQAVERKKGYLYL